MAATANGGGDWIFREKARKIFLKREGVSTTVNPHFVFINPNAIFFFGCDLINPYIFSEKKKITFKRISPTVLKFKKRKENHFLISYSFIGLHLFQVPCNVILLGLPNFTFEIYMFYLQFLNFIFFINSIFKCAKSI